MSMSVAKFENRHIHQTQAGEAVAVCSFNRVFQWIFSHCIAANETIRSRALQILVCNICLKERHPVWKQQAWCSVGHWLHFMHTF